VFLSYITRVVIAEFTFKFNSQKISNNSGHMTTQCDHN